MSKLLIDENPLVLLPSLVKKVGIERALVLQQIHYMCQQPKSGVTLDGEKWVWNTYPEWKEHYFSFWGESTIRRHFNKLEEEGLLLSCQPRLSDHDATKYYRVDKDKLDEYEQKVSRSMRQRVSASNRQRVSASNRQRVSASLKGTKTSSKTSTKNTTSLPESTKQLDQCNETLSSDVMKKDLLPPVEPSPPDRVFAYWKDKCGYGDAALFTDKRKKLVKARLKEYGEQMVMDAIDGCANSEWHQGHNDRKTRYQDLTLICRDGEHVEKFAEMHAKTVNPFPTPTKIDLDAEAREYAKQFATS